MKHSVHLSTLRSRVTAIVLPLLGCVLLASCSKEARLEKALVSGESYLAERDFDAARIEFMNAFRLAPASSEAIAGLGRSWYGTGAPITALPFLFETKRVDPENIAARVDLAYAAVDVSDLTAARTEALGLLDLMPESPDGMIVLADSVRSEAEAVAAESRLAALPETARNTPAFFVAKATIAAKRGDLNGAMSLADRALALDEKSPFALASKGNLQIANNEIEAGLETLKSAAAVSPPGARTALRYATLLAQSNRVDEAKSYLEELTSEIPSLVPAWQLLAELALQRGDYEETLDLLANVFSRYPISLNGRVAEAQALIKLGRPKEAIEKLEKTAKLKFYDRNPIIDFNLGLAFLATEERTRAYDALQRATSNQPGYVDALLVLSGMALEDGQPGQVVAAMETVLKARPGFAKAEITLADAHRRLGQYEESAAVFQKRISEGRGSADDHVFLGSVLRQQEDLAGARQAFEKAAEIAPESHVPKFYLAELDLKEGDYESAEKGISALTSNEAISAEVYYTLGRIYRAAGKSAQAEEAFLKASELRPSYIQAHERLVDSYAREDRLEKALAQLDKLLENTPSHSPALIRKALIHERLGEPQKAVDTYNSLSQTDPESTIAWNNLAYFFATEFKDYDKALEYAERARALSPEDPAVADTLGWICFLRNDLDRAAALVREASAKLPDAAEVDYHLGMINYMSGDLAGAKNNLERAVAKDQEFRGRDEAIARLAILDPSKKTADPAASGSVALEKLFAAQPGDPVVGVRLAETYLAEGKTADSARVYQALLDRNPRFVPSLIALAQFALQDGDSARATELATSAREASPGNTDSAAILGQIALGKGDLSRGQSLLGEALRDRAAAPKIVSDYIIASYKLGRIEDARDAAQRSASIPAAQKFLTLTAPGAIADPAALALSEAVITGSEKAPSLVLPAEILKANTALQSGDATAAESRLRDVLKTVPAHPVAARDLAASLVIRHAKAPAESKALLKESEELIAGARSKLTGDPLSAAIFGSTRFFEGDPSEAASIISAAATRLGKNAFAPFAHYILGKALVAEGDMAGAERAFKAALSTGLGEPFAAQAQIPQE